MANPSTNFELTRYSGVSLENTRLKFRELYLRQIYGANPNQSIVIEANSSTGLGETAVNDWAIYDGPSDDSNLVAHAQGIHVSAGNWYNSFAHAQSREKMIGRLLAVLVSLRWHVVSSHDN
jgi:hypothetical protein